MSSRFSGNKKKGLKINFRAKKQDSNLDRIDEAISKATALVTAVNANVAVIGKIKN